MGLQKNGVLAYGLQRSVFAAEKNLGTLPQWLSLVGARLAPFCIYFFRMTPCCLMPMNRNLFWWTTRPA